MAIIRNGIHGSVSGKVGPSVFVQTKTGNYVRSLPRVKKGRKPTPAQQESRQRFSLVRQALYYVLPVIRRGFAQCDPPKRAYDCAMSYNLKQAILKTDSGYLINWEKFMVAKGLPNPITSYQLVIDTEKKVLNISWTFDRQIERASSLRTFDSYLVLYTGPDSNHQDVIAERGRYSLEEGKQEIQLSAQVDSRSYHVYLFFYASDTSNKSTDSMYLGTLEW